MAGKKKAATSWRLAGEPVYPIPLPPADDEIFAASFSSSRKLRQRLENPIFQTPASVMKNREGAARASAGFLCKRFGSRYRQHEIIEAAATAASLPVMITEKRAGSLSFLMGAAFWLLDYAGENGLTGELLALLPETADDEIIFQAPMADDFQHTPDQVLRLMTVLHNRKGAGRGAFRNILRLIDKEAAASLRRAFLDCFLDYFERYMEVCARVRPAPPLESKSPLQPGFPSLAAVDSRGAGFDPVSAVVDEEPDVTFLLLSSALVGASDQELRSQLHFRRSVDLLRGFHVDDPFEICAAYLLLEKEGDALASLNTLTCAVIACADRHLPWGAGEAGVFPKTCEKGRPGYALRHTYVGTDPEAEEAGELPDVPAEDGQKLSEAQLFYFATGYALPRGCIPSRNLAGWFVRQGLPEQRAREFAFGAMLASYQDELRERLDLELPFDGIDGGGEAAGEEEVPAGASEADQAELLANLTRQVKELRRALYESERTAKQLQDRLLEEERQSAQERMELSKLRSVLYRMKSGESENEQPEETEIEFPWQVARRVLVFGGHETWLKVIRPLLPGARFFERESMPDLTALKGADVVWIQTNALSHKLFYRIINAARKENIPVRYFGYASARKCAEQLVMDELEESAAADL